ncbi:MAG: hypothetical protein K2O40_03780, partial [Lachnospiraceae bacterium]|nr:hypothetical protein [Lachnospiraceae bacterium]
FTEFKDNPIAAIYIIGLFGFFTYLLLWKKPKKVLSEESCILETSPETQNFSEVRSANTSIETNNAVYHTTNNSTTKQLETAQRAINNSLNELNKTISSGNILKVTSSLVTDAPPLPKQKSGDSYIEDGQMIIRTDGKEISDEEVPYLIQIGYEKAIENQTRLKTDLPLDLNEQEQRFFNELKLALSDIKRNITAERMSSGVISVHSNTFYVGKIKLSGRKHWMQILRGQTQIKVIDGELDDFIQHIPDWVRYIRIHCK